ncbi:hypothetical protein ACUNWD_03230 [Sunxiuqinia sp. A32]|uniref:hypothetical protein n=1 Tax=Sunxiuqinia sp. A32 TaxID=3461496 RepID=UPI004045FB3B
MGKRSYANSPRDVKLSCNTKVGEMNLVVPRNTRANVAVPKNFKDYSYISINGNKMKPDSVDNNFVYIGELEAGQYNIKFCQVEKDNITAKESLNYESRFLKDDKNTHGKWIGKCGEKGFMLFNIEGSDKHLKKLPDFIGSIDLAQNGNMHLENIKNDQRVLAPVQDNAAGRKLGAIITKDPAPCMQTMIIDIRCLKDQPYHVSLYLLDYENDGRRSAIEVFDLDSKALLMPVKIIKDYGDGKYVKFNASSSIRIRVNQVRGSNASLCGLFID